MIMTTRSKHGWISRNGGRNAVMTGAALLWMAMPLVASANPDLAPPEYMAATTQVGSYNSANILQKNTGAETAARIGQSGAYNNGSIQQTAYNDTAIVQQVGSGNDAGIVQMGVGDSAGVQQTGIGNHAGVFQLASNQKATVNELGLGDKALVIQAVPGLSANVNLTGIGTSQLILQYRKP